MLMWTIQNLILMHKLIRIRSVIGSTCPRFIFRLTVHLTFFWGVGGGVKMYLMFYKMYFLSFGRGGWKFGSYGEATARYKTRSLFYLGSSEKYLYKHLTALSNCHATSKQKDNVPCHFPGHCFHV